MYELIVSNPVFSHLNITVCFDVLKCEDYVNGSFRIPPPVATHSTIKTDSSFFGSIFSASAPANHKSASSTASDIIKVSHS